MSANQPEGKTVTTLLRNIPVKAVLSRRSLLWLAAVGVLATLLALLTIEVEALQNLLPDDPDRVPDDPDRVPDIRGMNWAMDGIVGWGLWGLTTFFDVVSFVTSAEAGIIYGLVGIGFLLLLGKSPRR